MNLNKLLYLAIAIKASSTFCPVLAEVSINATECSLANLSPSSLLTILSELWQSALLPKSAKNN